MNYTQNHHMPQWTASDRIRMEDFNQMSQDIEAGLDANARAAASAQAAAEEAKNAAKPYIVGHYTGDGDYQIIELDIEPSFVIISGMMTSFEQGRYDTFDHYFALVGKSKNLSSSVQIVGNKLVVYPENSNYAGAWHPSLNIEGRQYDFIAFR